MRVHDVEGAVGQPEGVDVARLEPDVDSRLGQRAAARPRGRRDWGRYPSTGPGATMLGQVHGDRPGTAAHVEHGHPRAQFREQVRGGVRHGAPARASRSTDS